MPSQTKASHASHAWPAVILLLAAAALFQLRLSNRERALDVLLPGEVLDVSALDDTAFERILRVDADCFIAWVMDPACPGCSQLADKHGHQMGNVPAFFWLFAGSPSAVRKFASRYRLSADQVLRLAPAVSVRDALHRLGVAATPTLLVIRKADFMIREVRVLNEALMDAPASIRASLCRNVAGTAGTQTKSP